MNWWYRFRSYWFPTKEERFMQGFEYAKRVLGSNPTEAEVDYFYEGLPMDDDPFDRGIQAYCRQVDWGK